MKDENITFMTLSVPLSFAKKDPIGAAFCRPDGVLQQNKLPCPVF
jgi:hypothetical protein